MGRVLTGEQEGVARLAVGHLVRPLARLHAHELADLLDGLLQRLHRRQSVRVLQFVLVAWRERERVS